MFTGIIQTIGIIKKITENNEKILTFEIAPQKKLSDLKIGSSIACDGVCLTVISLKKTSFTLNIVPETLKNTNLQNRKLNDTINLEQAIKLSDRLEGHFVLGHSDGIGKIQKITGEKNNRIITIKFPKKIKRYLSAKGSITINGVSLTIQNIAQDNLTVALIPFTLSHTNLGFLQAGDTINIEIDPISRYLETLFHE
ncbi:riboflavin synthase [Candidatus Peregrinibacteria bacterium]|nr:riboflavin synthase [Candidatus Peregrinibacteria bacterium]